MASIVVDLYEPDDMARQLSQFLQVIRADNEPVGLLDYMWFKADGKQVTMERKTWTALMSHMEMGRLETQINKALRVPKEVGLIIEGMPLPLMGGETAIYEVGKNPKYLRQDRIHATKYDFVMAFIWGLQQAGIQVYQTSSMWATVLALKSWVHNSEKLPGASTTLQRYIRPARLAWQPDKLVEMFMAIKDDGGYVLGEKRAMAVAGKIGSLYELCNMEPEIIAEVCDGISVNMARRLIKAMGGK